MRNGDDQWAPGGVRGSSSLLVLKGPRHVCGTRQTLVAGHVGLGGLQKHLINAEFRHELVWFGPQGRILNTEEDCCCYC